MEYINNIHQLLRMFDKYIYSKLKDKMPELYRTHIDWSNIVEYFPEENSPKKAIILKNSLEAYAQTYITVYKENEDFSISTLVSGFTVNKDGLSIDHFTPALRFYLNTDDNVEIYNSSINDLFIRFVKSDMLYPYLCMGKQQTCTFERIKNDFNSKLSNPKFVYTIIKPAEKVIFDLYNAAQIPFYFEAEIEKSSVGSGGKLLSITFKVKDYISILRRERMRYDYLEYIKEQIAYLFPVECLLLMEKIALLNDETVEEIYMMIKYLGKDPESYKILVDEYVKHKLQNQFKITFPHISAKSIL